MQTPTDRTVAPPEGVAGAAASAYPWRRVLAVFAGVSVLLTAVVAWSDRYRPDSGWAPVLQGPDWLDGWFQYDAGWYFHIASNGYFYRPGEQSSIAFFPAYPLGVRGLGQLVGDYQVAGSLLAVLCGGLAVVLFGSWVWQRLPRAAAVTAIAVLMLYPYAFFLYGAMYADSLFLLCAVGSFLLLERRWFWAAGLVGALATAGRPVGVAVAVGLVVRTLEMLAEDRRDRAAAAAAAPGATVPVVDRPGWRDLLGALRLVRVRHLGVLLSSAGLVAWMAYLWVEFDEPLAFVEVEGAPGWNQGVGPRTWFKVVYLGTLVKGPYAVAALLTLQALACLCAVLLVRRVWRRFGWGYAAYAVVVLAIPIIGTKDFMGTGRYVLVAFPVLAAAGDYLASSGRRWVRPLALGTCGVLLLVLTYLFGRSVAVS
ncbi:hypothetical protein [Cellulomonas cellasea]|uniref:hypothetical protein n=1 Tax=Cellulomonas cellasea TaxID=43670 RepID=UPI0011417BAB|nr:hypothetical protein [Cellulomonas cellasea]